METQNIVKKYFEEDVPFYEGIKYISPMANDFHGYNNTGFENGYSPGNIIIYEIETVKDTKVFSVSVARKSKSEPWKVINFGK